MSMAFPGMTHCSECYSPLNMGEFGLCRSCQQKEEERRELHEQKMKEAKLKETIRKEATDIMKEFTSVMAESKSIDQMIPEVEISAIKPENMDYTTWYSTLGFDIMKLYLQGIKEVKIKFIEESDDNEK